MNHRTVLSWRMAGLTLGSTPAALPSSSMERLAQAGAARFDHAERMVAQYNLDGWVRSQSPVAASATVRARPSPHPLEHSGSDHGPFSLVNLQAIAVLTVATLGGYSVRGIVQAIPRGDDAKSLDRRSRLGTSTEGLTGCARGPRQGTSLTRPWLHPLKSGSPPQKPGRFSQPRYQEIPPDLLQSLRPG